MKSVLNIDVELPVLKKVFFCIPLQPGLVAWGGVQLFLTLVYALVATIEFGNNAHNGPHLVAQIVVFMFCMIWTLLEVFNCGFLFLGAQKRNANFLEVCFDYMVAKLVVFAGLLIMCIVVQLILYNCYRFQILLDSWMGYFLCQNPAFGVLIWVSQLYLLLLINGMIVSLGHCRELKTLFSRIRKSNTHNVLTEDIQDSKDDLKKIDVVC